MMKNYTINSFKLKYCNFDTIYQMKYINWPNINLGMCCYWSKVIYLDYKINNYSNLNNLYNKGCKID